MDGRPRVSGSVIADAQSAELDEERLAVERAQRGDVRALEPILARHAEPLYAQVVLPRIGDRTAAEDVVRDTLLVAIEKIHSFQWQNRSLFFWLRQIALNKLIDLHRARGRSRKLTTALEDEVGAAPPATAVDDALIAEEDRRRAFGRIELAMAELPERYARAIRLRLVEERSRQECADAMGTTLGNFDVILFRAVRAFRKAYGDRDE